MYLWNFWFTQKLVHRPVKKNPIIKWWSPAKNLKKKFFYKVPNFTLLFIHSLINFNFYLGYTLFINLPTMHLIQWFYVWLDKSDDEEEVNIVAYWYNTIKLYLLIV